MTNEEMDGQTNFQLVSCAKGEDNYDFSVAMNYGYSAGSPQLLRFITEHVEMIHNPPYDDWESCLTCGTTSALDIAFRMLCNRGDVVLVEKFTYPGAIAAMRGQGLNMMGIEMDNFGLVPEDLEQKLGNWDYATGPKPFVLYTIPTGQNPTGATQTAGRRRQIYDIAVKHDLYIIEDDPYYFLQLHHSNLASPTRAMATLDNYIARLPPSYLSMDESGRVLRMDTASKILAPGLRCGWITGSSQVVEKFIAYSEISVLSPSGPSQIMMYKLLDQSWGHDGFVRWLATLSQQYTEQRDTMIHAAEAFLPADICSWKVPESGMFLWVSIDLSRQPSLQCLNSGPVIRDICSVVEDNIYERSKRNGVLVSKGSWFAIDSDAEGRVLFRLTFVAAAQKELSRAVQTFAQAVRYELVRK
ncbi:aromatic aminotransferase Aro8 [Purpureocillium lavendulum]|uniref:Aromatic aminotransferase Aro8 n=1 Tax=Purpureocillium lavendulum TaxID=1247861 RepID=A0AB34G6I0_9HYPO|nr:aromatic aminotransferase Aro8 [Purpureocillium lavendulum]